jgi:hypothetical protein
MHELIFRSLGGDPTDAAWMVPLCGECHGDIHMRVGGKRKRIEATTEAGALGPLRFFERTGDEWYEVT